MTEKVDFHVHYSGDVASTQNLLKEAKQSGVTALALVGRLEISDNLGQLIDIGKKEGVEVFSGVEYPVRINGNLVDLVAVGFDYKSFGIKELFGQEERRRDNADVAKQQKVFLEGKGFVIEGENEEDKKLLAQLLSGDVSEKAIRFCAIAARDSRNRDLIEKMKMKDTKLWGDTFARYSGRPGYLEKADLYAKFLWREFFDFSKEGYVPVQKDARKIIDAVHAARGVVLYSPEGKFDEGAWEKLKGLGIDGIMGWHGSTLEIDKNAVKDVLGSGLLVLGGSDFHPEKEEWKIGSGNGALYMSKRRLNDLKKYISSKFD